VISTTWPINYGRDAVSQIITFGTMAAKAVVRDVARVQGKPYTAWRDRLSKLIPFAPRA
jgi:DNA polymerase-3 subunit alpha